MEIKIDKKMLIKEYRIKVVSGKAEHRKVKKEMEGLFNRLNGELEGCLEFYTQRIENHRSWGSYGKPGNVLKICRK